MATYNAIGGLFEDPQAARQRYEENLFVSPQAMGQQSLLNQLISVAGNSGAMAGMAGGRLLGGQLPEERKAMEIEEINKIAQEQPDEAGYYKTLIEGLRSKGYLKEAMSLTDRFKAAQQEKAKATFAGEIGINPQQLPSDFIELSRQAAAAGDMASSIKYMEHAKALTADLKKREERQNVIANRAKVYKANVLEATDEDARAIASDDESWKDWTDNLKASKAKKDEKPELVQVGVTPNNLNVYKYYDPNTKQVSQVIIKDVEGQQVKVPYSGTVAEKKPLVSIDNQGRSAEAEAMAKVYAKRFETAVDDATKAQEQLRTFRDLRVKNRTGLAFGGPQANIMVGAANFFESIGMLSKEGAATLSKAQSFDKATRDVIFQELGGKLGAQVSNTDLKFIQDRMAQLSTSPQAREEVLAKLEEIAGRKISYYEKMEKHRESNKGSLEGFQFAKPPELPELPAFVSIPAPVSKLTDAQLQDAKKRASGGKP